MTSTSTDRRFGVNSGMAVKVPCLAVSTSNITLSGEQTVDGVACVTGDRVLVTGQTSTANNGIYTVDTGTWTRTPDFDSSFDAVKGTLIYVTDGSTNGNSWWTITTDDPFVIGTTGLAFGEVFLGSLATLTFLQAGSGAVTRSANTKMREVYSVRDLGAVGDLVTNDTIAVDGTVDVAAGRRVFVPQGQYLIPTSLSFDGTVRSYDGLQIEGEGWDWTRRNSVSELVFSGAVGPLLTIQGDPASAVQLNEVVIRNLSFRATSGALVGALVRLCHVAEVLFENCNFEANSAGTLIEGTAWITVRFKNCRFYKAAVGVETKAIAGFGTYANVIKFEDCWFDKLAKSTDFTYAGRTVDFDHCVWEPTEASAASPNLVGNYTAFFRECWFGDANGTGTWVTATGEMASFINCDCTGGAIGYDIATSFCSLVEGGRMDGTTSPIKLRNTVKGVVRGARLLLTANNSIGIDVTAGSGHVLEDNDVVISGGVTGTTGYRLATGTSGVLRDRKIGTTAVTLENNSTLWNIDLQDYVEDVFNELVDNFVGEEINSFVWQSAVGTDAACVGAQVFEVLGGVARMVTGAGAGADMATNGVQLYSKLNWQASQGGLSCEFRVKLSAVTNVALFIGLTDQTSTLEMPFTLAAGDVLTSNASDAVGVLFDTGADTDNWWLVGVANDVDATKQNTGSPAVTGTYERWRIVVSTGGVATFYRNGVKVGTTMTGSVRTTIPLTPVVAAFARAAGSRNVDTDRIRVRQFNY